VICPYCKTESKDTKVCDFCEADLEAERPTLDPWLSDDAINQTQPQLAQRHTYDLMRLLSHVRSERTKWYKTMQDVRKASKETPMDDSQVDFFVNEYKTLTARKNIIEQLLVDRMGYYPDRIDSKLLQALKSKIERTSKHEQKRGSKTETRGI
jgi:ABC-type taurine transport system substrate-binding protein